MLKIYKILIYLWFPLLFIIYIIGKLYKLIWEFWYDIQELIKDLEKVINNKS